MASDIDGRADVGGTGGAVAGAHAKGEEALGEISMAGAPYGIQAAIKI